MIPLGTPLDARFRRRRAQNWIFLGLMYGFFYMSRYNFAAIAPSLSKIFGWTNTQYGLINSAGKITYAFSVFLSGPLADKIGGKRAILFGCAGAAVFNLLFGACFIFLADPATKAHPAVFAHGMKATSMIATFAVLWACNHYFQSFGALSIVKINAAWFRVTERGVFAGIFGMMIQGGRWLGYGVSPIILHYLPWQYCFWIPSVLLVVMWFGNKLLVENSPQDAGLEELHTGDETAAEQAAPATLGYVLRKVFANPTMWLIASASLCIGMVRNGMDDWWSKYMATVFNQSDLAHFAPYEVGSFLLPIAAVAGGLAAGTASDKIFHSRRAPVICLAFLGQITCLVLLSQSLEHAWAACVLLAAISFFVQSSHSLVGGAASMDFGGKKAVATAAGLFDGAQYLAGAIMSYGLGRLIDHFVDKAHPGVEFHVWPYAPIPFALLGAVIMVKLWNARPGASAHGPAVRTVAVAGDGKK